MESSQFNYKESEFEFDPSTQSFNYPDSPTQLFTGFDTSCHFQQISSEVAANQPNQSGERLRLDSEYLWEGEDEMFEDIVASTLPNLYIQPSLAKHMNEDYNQRTGYFNQNNNSYLINEYQNYHMEEEDVDLKNDIRLMEEKNTCQRIDNFFISSHENNMQPNQIMNQEQQLCRENLCGRNGNDEFEKNCLDSTIVSNCVDLQQSQYLYDCPFEDDDIEMQNPEEFQTFNFGDRFKTDQGNRFEIFQEEEKKRFQPKDSTLFQNQNISFFLNSESFLLKNQIQINNYQNNQMINAPNKSSLISNWQHDFIMPDINQDEKVQKKLKVLEQITNAESQIYKIKEEEKIPIKKSYKKAQQIREIQQKIDEKQNKAQQENKTMQVDNNKEKSNLTEINIEKKQKNQIKNQNANEQIDKYYKKFDFFYKRTCFRLMAEFYKHLFSPFQKQWIEQKKKSPMINLIKEFAIQYFDTVLQKINPQFQQEFITMLMVVVHSHRHNKDEEFISEVNIDFSLVRDTMYKYSKKAQEKFFSFPIFAFLFLWFAQSSLGISFAKEKLQKKGNDYYERMTNELSELKEEAMVSIQAASSMIIANSMQNHTNSSNIKSFSMNSVNPLKMQQLSEKNLKTGGILGMDQKYQVLLNFLNYKNNHQSQIKCQ